MKPHSRAHLRPALAAFLSVALGFGWVEWSVRTRLPGYMDRFATTMAPVKLTGNVLQTAAFRSPATLVVYGSSELDKPAENRPDEFFSNRPTGFGVFPIGKAGNTCLVLLAKLAAAGEAVRGKKVAVFLSPSWFLRDASADAVGANLKPLQVGSWVFGGSLKARLKRDVARRLLAFPDTFRQQPLLNQSLHDLAEDTPCSRARLFLLTPIGRTQNFLLKRAEYWAILRDLSTLLPTHRQRVQALRHTDLAPPVADPDWPGLADAGEAHDRALGDASPFSIGAPTRDEKRFHAGGSGSKDEAGAAVYEEEPANAIGVRDEDFHAKLAHSGEWTDLDLLLRALHESGAQGLIISQPFNGRYRDAGGNTPDARRAYYRQLDEVVHHAGFPVRNFSEHEEDRTFFSDSGHPSAKAWVYYDKALDDFYHGRKVSADVGAR